MDAINCLIMITTQIQPHSITLCFDESTPKDTQLLAEFLEEQTEFWLNRQSLQQELDLLDQEKSVPFPLSSEYVPY